MSRLERLLAQPIVPRALPQQPVSRTMQALDILDTAPPPAPTVRPPNRVHPHELRETSVDVLAIHGDLAEVEAHPAFQSTDHEEKRSRTALWQVRKLAEHLQVAGDTKDLSTLLGDAPSDSAANTAIKSHLRAALAQLDPAGVAGPLSATSRTVWQRGMTQLCAAWQPAMPHADVLAKALQTLCTNAPAGEFARLQDAWRATPDNPLAVRALANHAAWSTLDCTDAWEALVHQHPITVAVQGAGPAGMTAGLQAAKALDGTPAQVHVFDKRPGAPSRANMVALTQTSKEIVQGIDPALGSLFQFDDPSVGERVELAQMEKALESAGARFNHLHLHRGVQPGTCAAQSPTGPATLHLPDGTLQADLVIFAMGSAASKRNPTVAGGRNHGGLGEQFSYLDLVGLKDHMGVAVFRLQDGSFGAQIENDTPAGFEPGSDKVSHWCNIYTALDRACVLFSAQPLQMAGKTAQHQQVMQDVALKNAPLLQQADRLAMDVVDIELRRANQMVAAQTPTILVGDSAQTPHPYTGSGANAAIAVSAVVQRLVKSLQAAKAVESLAPSSAQALRNVAFTQYDHEARRIANFCVGKSIVATVVLGRKHRTAPTPGMLPTV